MLTDQLQTPGIYREEVFSLPAPTLLTGVPAFLGFAQKGPINVPQPLTLWHQFEEMFGPALEDGYLAYAVRGFFENEGGLCFVVRLNDDATVSAVAALGRGDSEAETGGLGALMSLDTPDLVCAPDIMRGVSERDQVLRMQQAILQHCDERGDRFAILDSLPWIGVDADQSLKEAIAQREALQSINGALYYPWIKIENGPDKTRGFIPPCGHIAGAYARSDERVGVHKAPANEAIAGALDVQVNLTNRQQERLNPVGINCLRAFPGRGIRVWGARTISHAPEWIYINVRRLFLTIGRWLEFNLNQLAFEPNDLRLWVRIERELTAYLEDLLEQGAFRGLTATDAFYVKCNAETNPPNIRDAGMVVTEVGIAPVVPCEFIKVRIILSTSGVTITG